MNPTSIAVLPFANMSSDPEQAFFSDGITEEIINALAQIKGLKVTSRTSSFAFKEKNLSVKEIAEQLGVETILEGSVRVGNGMVRITAQLIETENDYHFWSEKWDRKLENIFEVQDEVSLLIADKLREEYGHLEFGNHLIDKPTDNLDAYALSLEAKQLFNNWNPDDVRKSIELFEEALALDPNHVDAYVGLADAYGFMGTTEMLPAEEAWMKAVEYTHKGFELDPNDAGVHYQLAHMAFFTECDFSKAFQHFERAIELKPSYAEAHQFMTFLYTLADNWTLAQEHLRLAYELNPLSQETLFFNAYLHYCKGDYSNAEKKLDQCLADNPKNIPAAFTRCYCWMMQERYEETLAFIRNMPEEVAIEDEIAGIECLCSIHLDDQESVAITIGKLQQKSDNLFAAQAHSYLFLAFVHQGRFDEAFDWLDQALAMKSAVIQLSFSDPLSAPLQKDRRYQDYHQRLYHAALAKGSDEDSKSALLDEPTAKAYIKKLLDFVGNESPYLNPSISLRMLADMIEIHPNQLSWLLNAEVGKNFNEFINGYRIARFKELAVDPENSHISLIGLAYESGFNSKTVFNTTFKKLEGTTPGAFIKSQTA